MILVGITNHSNPEGFPVSLIVHIPSSSIPSLDYYCGSMSDFLRRLEYNKAYYVTGVIYKETLRDNKIYMNTPMAFAKTNTTNFHFPGSYATLPSHYFGIAFFDSEDYQTFEWEISEADDYFDHVYLQTCIELI